MNREHKFNIAYALIAIWVVIALQGWLAASGHVENLPYSEFEKQLASGNIQNVEIDQGVLRGKLKKPLPDKRDYFITRQVDTELASKLDAKDVTFAAVKKNTFLKSLIGWTLPTLIFFGFWLLIIRPMAQRQMGNVLSVGKSRAHVYVESDTKTTFADVAGAEEAKAELEEIVDFLKSPDRAGRLGGRLPKGVLLVGPPGTGKTLLARAVAGEAGVAFLSISGSEFVEMYVGVGAARMRDLFAEANAKAPCIIFIDELDAVGRARMPGLAGGFDEKEQTLNQLLTEMDGFDSSTGVIILAATNRPEVLDPALLRAGRFDRHVVVDRPDKIGRHAILRLHAKKTKLAEDVDLQEIAALTGGFSGADLANLINEAALAATRAGHDAITQSDLVKTFEKIVAGPERPSRMLSPDEKRVVAFHELGHALVASSLPGQDPVQKISIIPRGVAALGYTMQRPAEDRRLLTRTALKDKMAVLLGGRAAEQIVFGEITTGAADDLQRVTDIARHMARQYGMIDDLGQLVYENAPSPFLNTPGAAGVHDYSEETAREIDEAVRSLIKEAYAKATDILMRRRDDLNAGAELLLSTETLTASEFPPLMQTLSEDV